MAFTEDGNAMAGMCVELSDYEAVVANNDDPPLFLHNDGRAGGRSQNHFVSFKLVGTRINRDAMEARIKLRAGGLSQMREIGGGGSFMSQSDLRAHFGLGGSTRADEVEMRWPSGLRQLFQ
jgi:enediyne biosynthesis protein E4